jgi:hypothetical protein
MFVSFHPEHTKKTRCDNNFKNDTNNRNNDFFRPILTNPQVPMSYSHDQYYCDNNLYNQTNNINHNFNNISYMDLERSSISTRNNVTSNRKPVQTNFQNDYYSTNYDTLNNVADTESNKYLTRNPVNTKRDIIEKERNKDKQDFLKSQGGYLNNPTEFKYESTRKGRAEINSSNYIPMPCTMAIPKEHI